MERSCVRNANHLDIMDKIKIYKIFNDGNHFIFNEKLSFDYKVGYIKTYFSILHNIEMDEIEIKQLLIEYLDTNIII